MNRETATIELNRRLNLLKPKEINKRDLRNGLSNLNQRKEIGSYNKKIESERTKTINKLNSLKSFVTSSGDSEYIEPEISLDIFNKPNLKTTRRAGIGFWN
jgi:hypothetical protein